MLFSLPIKKVWKVYCSTYILILQQILINIHAETKIILIVKYPHAFNQVSGLNEYVVLINFIVT